MIARDFDIPLFYWQKGKQTCSSNEMNFLVEIWKLLFLFF